MVIPLLRISHFVPYSRANGPGVRAVLWVQGCSLGCPGCFNPHTHPASGGQWLAVDDLFATIAALGNTIAGVTVSGGEPMQQPAPLAALLRRVRQETPLSTLLFSGYTWGELQRLAAAGEVLASLDVLVAGRYDAAQHLARGLRGSANKSVHFLTCRYGPPDLAAVPPGEVIIRPDGDVELSGIDPLRW